MTRGPITKNQIPAASALIFILAPLLNRNSAAAVITAPTGTSEILVDAAHAAPKKQANDRVLSPSIIDDSARPPGKKSADTAVNMAKSPNAWAPAVTYQTAGYKPTTLVTAASRPTSALPVSSVTTP